MPPIRLFPDAVLRQRSTPVSEVDEAVRRLIRNLVQEMHDQPDGVGLAAPQLGVLRRVFVFDVGEGPQAVVNPAIDRRSGSETRIEGCLSIPGLYYPVTRPASVRLSGLDEQGRRTEFSSSGLAARVVQHEVDHLDGVLFIDRLERAMQAEAKRRLREHVLQLAS